MPSDMPPIPGPVPCASCFTLGPPPLVGAPLRVPDPPPDLVGVRDVARLLKLSVRAVWRLRERQELPRPIRLGGAIRWRRDEIARWIQAGCPSQAGRGCGGATR